MHDYAPSVLAFAAAARLALHNGAVEELDRQVTRAMRARPSCTYAFPFLAVRGRLHLAKVYVARSDHATARHLLREIDDILGHRPDLGTLVDEVRDFRGSSHVRRRSHSRWRAATHPRRAASAALPADPPDDRRDRRAAVRLPQHRQLGGRLDLPQARRLLTQRRGGAGNRHRAPRRIGRLRSAGRLLVQRIGVVSERHRQFGGRGHNPRRTHDCKDADQNVDHLGCARTGIHGRIRRRPRRRGPRPRPPPARRGGPGPTSGDPTRARATPRRPRGRGPPTSPSG